MKIEFTKSELEQMVRKHLAEIIPGLIKDREVVSMKFQEYSHREALTIELAPAESDEASEAA
jgi:hypothetical protein